MTQIRNRRRKDERGLTLISVVISTIALVLVAMAVTNAFFTLFGTSRDAEPRSIGQHAVSNVQTDLNALTMYDPGALAKLTPGQTITEPAPTNIAAGKYPPSDVKPTKITVQQVTGAGTQATLNVNYAVPGGPGNGGLTGNSTVSVFQKAPNGCDPQLKGVPGTGC